MSKLFDLLGFNFDEFTNKLIEARTELNDKYTDFLNNNFKKYDIDTQEGYEAFIKDVSDLRTSLIKSDNIFSNSMVNILDKIVEGAMKRHSEVTAQKKDPIKEIVNTEVERVKEENGGQLVSKDDYDDLGKRIFKEGMSKCECEGTDKQYDPYAPCCEDCCDDCNDCWNDGCDCDEDNGIEWPSENLTYKQRRNISRIVDEYMDTKVLPYLDEDTDDEVIEDMASGLFEFAAWVLTRDEE